MPDRKILIVGGYGVVGRRIAARLAPTFPDRLVIAGRDEQSAAALCREIGQGTRPRRIDVDDIASVEAALGDIGTIVMCVAQRELYLLRSAIARGLAYTDIAPRLAFWRGAEQLEAQARRTRARILLGAGLSPGISNMMARRLADMLGQVGRIETALLLSLGDEYGPDSLHHVFEAIAQSFSIMEEGRSRVALPFSEGARVRFPDPLGTKTAYLFPWSDVVYYPKTLGAQTAIGRFALQPAWSGHLAGLLARAGSRRWIRRPGFVRGCRRAIERLARSFAAHDDFALVVTAEAAERTIRMTLAGRKQAEATADGAALLARLLADGEMSAPGVWLPEQVVSADGFFDALARTGWNVTFEEPAPRDDGKARGPNRPHTTCFASPSSKPPLDEADGNAARYRLLAQDAEPRSEASTQTALEQRSSVACG